jgi:hypothetical protein
VLDGGDLEATADAIEACQLPSGLILWHRGGHADPWNHAEAAMALAAVGRLGPAAMALEWLARNQEKGGFWYSYYHERGVKDRRIDTNACAYPAVAVLYCYRVTGDLGLLEEFAPMALAGVDFTLSLMDECGRIPWCLEENGSLGRYSLLAATSSIYLSARAAATIASIMGREPRAYGEAALKLAQRVGSGRGFADKSRYAMDWYYPVLSGALGPEESLRRLFGSWDTYVIEGLGVRCVADKPWVTAAETAECALALDRVGQRSEAIRLLKTTEPLRLANGEYLTGLVYPEAVPFPQGETTSYTAAAIVLAHAALFSRSPGAGFFRGQGIWDPGSGDHPDQYPEAVDGLGETEVARV